MADPQEKLSREGFNRQEVENILNRAVELQSQQEDRRLRREDLREGAEAVGIDDAYIDQAIRELREQQARERREQAERSRLLKIAGGVLAVILVLLLVSGHSRLNARMAEVEEQRAQLENVLQRRHDLIPNLISLSKTSAAHEKALVNSLSELQSQARESDSFAERQRIEQQIGATIERLMNSLRADANTASALFIRLSDEMAGAENRIAVERMRYNQAVGEYNRTARGFFISLVRPFLNFPAEIPYFEASEAARETPRF